MAASVLYSGAFDLATYGDVSINWTDTAGAHSVTMSTGTYTIDAIGPVVYAASSHSTLSALASFIDALVAAMDAQTARTVTGSFSQITGLATLACTGGLFTISFVGASGARMQALLGFTGAITGAATYTGASHPYFCIRPALPCVTAYKQPAKEKGRTVSKRTSDGAMLRYAPATIVRITSWRHDFEPKAMVDRQWFDASLTAAPALNVYTWEDLWEDYGDHVLPIFAAWYYDTGTLELLAFDLLTDVYDETTHDRMSPRDDVRFKVTIAASLRARVVG